MHWYPYLSKSDSDSLFSHIKRENAKIAICKITRNEKRIYGHISNVGGLIELLKTTQLQYLAYHEVILGERPQKMRFDIDLTVERAAELGMDCSQLHQQGGEICNSLLDSIIRTINSMTGRTLELMKDIIITDSSSTYKFSQHIILTTTSIAGHKEARHLFDIITSPFSEWVRNGIIDQGIYASTNQFRILGCIKKVGDNRVKKLVKDYTYRDRRYIYTPKHTNPEVDNYQLLTSSLIGNVEDCELVKIVVPVRELPNLAVGDSTIEHVIRVVDREFPDDYEFSDVKGNAVCFSRMRPSYCDICRRIHEKMGMLVLVQPGRLVHYCGRSGKIGQILEGDLGEEYSPYTPDSDDELDVGVLLGPYIPSLNQNSYLTNSANSTLSNSMGSIPINSTQNPYLTNSMDSAPTSTPTSTPTSPQYDEESVIREAKRIISRRTMKKNNTPPTPVIEEITDFSKLVNSPTIPTRSTRTTNRIKLNPKCESKRRISTITAQPIPDNYDDDSD